MKCSINTIAKRRLRVFCRGEMIVTWRKLSLLTEDGFYPLPIFFCLTSSTESERQVVLGENANSDLKEHADLESNI